MCWLGLIFIKRKNDNPVHFFNEYRDKGYIRFPQMIENDNFLVLRSYIKDQRSVMVYDKVEGQEYQFMLDASDPHCQLFERVMYSEDEWITGVVSAESFLKVADTLQNKEQKTETDHCFLLKEFSKNCLCGLFL